MINILLACGAGCSSGFIASNMRKAAKAKGLEVTVKAVSDIEIKNEIAGKDLLMVGPHIKHRLPEIEKIVNGKAIIGVIDQKKYSLMDGPGILDDALKLLSEKGGE